jgi:hypothetical protein
MPSPFTGRSSGASVARILSSFRAGSKVARRSRAAGIPRNKNLGHRTRCCAEVLPNLSCDSPPAPPAAAEATASPEAPHTPPRFGIGREPETPSSRSRL